MIVTSDGKVTAQLFLTSCGHKAAVGDKDGYSTAVGDKPSVHKKYE